VSVQASVRVGVGVKGRSRVKAMRVQVWVVVRVAKGLGSTIPSRFFFAPAPVSFLRK